MANHTQTRVLLDDILKRVSRSFYLTIKAVPASVRDQIGVAYLFARAADTIADTDVIERSRRLVLLKEFKAQFAGEHVDFPSVQSMQSLLVPHQATPGERSLLSHLTECFHVYESFSPADRARLRRLLQTLTNGMEMDLTVFPGDSSKDVTALATMEDLDRYTYYVAGCVGEFWTAMMCAHLPSLAHWNVAEMAQVGVRFGKGLQLTNIIKDLSRDLKRGRCYVPAPMLTRIGLEPSALLDPGNRHRFRPVLLDLLRMAREHLDQGWLYTMAIPRRELRLRLACMWPILFAGETLRLVSFAPALLDPSVNVKMSKRRVYGIMGLTTLTGGCGYVGTAYWGRLRKQLP
ncbi:MAG TPA: phytoene/squalene synthase family protein [Nitrospiraceae bacterium]|nr:phytoene/squalene synthase family protein [Nitrospiraceae bacterium]